MSLKTISEAASQVGVKREILEDWIKQGLLTAHCSPGEGAGNPESEAKSAWTRSNWRASPKVWAGCSSAQKVGIVKRTNNACPASLSPRRCIANSWLSL